MKPSTKIYFKSINNQRFLYTDESLSCERCGASPQAGFYFEGYSTFLAPLRRYLCQRCKDVDFPKGYNILYDHVLVVGFVPKGASIWTPQPPALVSASVDDVFSMARKADGSEVVDDTVYADRLSLGGVSIGLPPALVSVPSDDDISLMLSGKPVLPVKNELLEGGV